MGRASWYFLFLLVGFSLIAIGCILVYYFDVQARGNVQCEYLCKENLNNGWKFYFDNTCDCWIDTCFPLNYSGVFYKFCKKDNLTTWSLE